VAADRTITLEERRGDKARSAPPPAPGVLVLFSEGAFAGSGVYPGLPRMSIGRRPDQDIFIEDQGLSRQHAVLAFDGAAIRLRDLGSHNGTHLNGVRLPREGEQPVCFGDVIRCGSTLLLAVSDVTLYKGWPADAAREPLLGGPEVQRVLRAVDLLAPQEIGVLVTGESGTGKELVATLLHERSGRTGRLVTLNCAAVPAPLFEAELFGVKRGAFTGADADRPGLVREAHEGTLFLDEIGELPLELQPKLLRVLEQRQVRPVGGDQATRIALRVVTATNRALEGELERGRFREDLYHRLRGATVHLPPLRERREDILLLARHALQATSRGDTPLPLAADAAEALLLHRWPGNVRELQHVVQEAELQARMDGSRNLSRRHLKLGLPVGEGTGAELHQVSRALERCGGNVVQAAAELGISRGKLYRILGEHRLRAADFRRRRGR